MSAQVKMAIFYADEILGRQIKGSFPKIMFLFKSQDGHILCRINLELTKYRGVISWSGYMYYSLSEYISHHLKRYRTTCRLKALDAYLNKNIYCG